MSVAFAGTEYYPIMNTTQTVPFGTCYNVTSGDNWQVFCAPAYPQLNVDTILGFDEAYSNSATNITIRAPSYPKLNISTTLPYGETFYNSIANITVKSLPFPSANVNLNAGQSYQNMTLTVNCAVAPKYNIAKVLGYDEEYKNSEANINITSASFPRLNINKELLYGEQFAPSDARYNLSITCKWLNLVEYEGYKTSYTTMKTECDAAKIERDNTKTELTTTINTVNNLTADLNTCKTTPVITTVIPTSNKSCNYTTVMINNVNVSYCPEDVTTLCTPEEKLAGKLSDCINRLALDATTQKEQLTQQLTVCNTDKTRCESGEKTNQDNADKWTMIIVGLAACIGGGWLMTEYLKHKRAVEE